MNNFHIGKKERQIIFLFLFFPLLLLILFGVIPVINLVYYSFTSWNGISSVKEFIGFKNYITILTNPKYIEVFINNTYYFVSGILQIIIALYLAIALSFKVKFKEVFKAIYILPMLISGVAVSMMFRLFFEPYGTFDYILNLLGLSDHIKFWLGDPRIVNFTLAFISLWKRTCASFIIYYGAIQTIPPELYKVAEIEGANIIHKVRYVILPNIHIVLKINFVLLIIGSISAFEIPLIMTNGSNGTATFLLQTMKTAFERKNIGLASSMAVILTIVIVIMTLIQRKIIKGDEDEF